MLFSGNNYRLIPETNQLGFVLSGITINGTGNSEFGFSGNSNFLKFQFLNKKIYSPDNKIIGSYNTGEPFSIKGYIDTGRYQYYVNDDLIANRKTKSNYNLQRFFVQTTGADLTANIVLSCPQIPYSISFDSKFNALTRITGRLNNSSTINFYVFDSSTTFYQSNQELFLGDIGGKVTGGTDFVFSFSDANTSRFDNDVEFSLNLHTSIGDLSGTFTTSRVSGLDHVVRKLTSDTGNVNLYALFDGSGIPTGQFTYVPTPASHTLIYYANASNLRGEPQSKSLKVVFEPITPMGGQSYKSEYVTGIKITSSGEYLFPPTAKFTGYYYVSDLNWDVSRIILSSGCSGIVPVTFTETYGKNASGYLSVKKTLLSGVYDAGINTYYLPTGFTMVSGGTGYIEIPKANLQTGIYANCYDVAAKFGFNSSIYTPFSGSGSLKSSADYLTGEVLTVTGLVSGGLRTGYRVTGIEITNPGSGYNATYFPMVSFVRKTGDTLSGNATGVISIKQSGTYSFTEHWSIKTGISNTSLVAMTGTSGVAVLSSTQNYLTIQVTNSGRDNTQSLNSQVTVSLLEDGQSITHIISGQKRYDTSTGFLKKKNSLELTLLPIGSELSFLLTQDELDTYYSSDDFVNPSETIDLGDLEF